MIITIHQPNFFPWYPFFQKLQSADKFIFLNHSQYQKNNLQNRFSHNEKWYTMSVNSGLELINKKTYLNPKKDWDKIKYNLKNYFEILNKFDDLIDNNLVKTNTKIIERICNILNINTEILFDYPTTLNSSDRLIDLCLHFGADTYLSGISGKNYLDLNKFNENGIRVIYQNEDSMIKKSILEILKKDI